MIMEKEILGSEKMEEELRKKLKANVEAIKNLVEKIKYIDIEVVDLINEELNKLKEEKKQIEDELLYIEKCRQNEITFKIDRISFFVSEIIDNCFKTFELLDIKTKKDIVRMFVEDMSGSGKNISVKMFDIK